jgi:hypothetical protein
VTLAEPDRVETHGLGGARHLDQLGPSDGALDLRQLHANATPSGHGRSVRESGAAARSGFKLKFTGSRWPGMSTLS